jgi:hypothetical protein
MNQYEDCIHKNSILRNRLNHLLLVRQNDDHANVILLIDVDNVLQLHYHIFLLKMRQLHEMLVIVDNMFED